MRAHAGYAIHHMFSRASAAATQRIRLAIKHSDTSMLWVLVQVSSGDGTRSVNRILKIDLQGSHPRPPEQHQTVTQEKIVWVPSKPLGDGWVDLDVRVPELVHSAWGKEGWKHNSVRGLQLHGNVAISPISLMKWLW
jgi:hypothetical protein